MDGCAYVYPHGFMLSFRVLYYVQQDGKYFVNMSKLKTLLESLPQHLAYYKISGVLMVSKSAVDSDLEKHKHKLYPKLLFYLFPNFLLLDLSIKPVVLLLSLQLISVDTVQLLISSGL